MNVHEYQAKELFREFGVAVPEGALATTPEEAESRIRAAEEYASLVHAVHAHKEMLFDYGHSLEKEREQLKKATSTARFVGLDMPEATYDHEKHDAEEAARRAKDPGAASEDEDASAR